MFIRGFWNDETGATAIEHGSIARLVSVTVIGALKSMLAASHFRGGPRPTDQRHEFGRRR